MSRKIQVTCLCSAYPFPHRVSGGLCTGSEWAISYRELDGLNCGFCEYSSVNGSDSCEVSEGTSSIVDCRGYLEYLETQTSQRLPPNMKEGEA